MCFATHQLVAAAHELDKLASVDIWVTAVFDILEELGRYGGEGVGRRGGCVDFLERLGERLARWPRVSVGGEGEAGASTFRLQGRLCLVCRRSRRMKPVPSPGRGPG